MIKNIAINSNKKLLVYLAIFVFAYIIIIFLISQIVNVDLVKGKIENFIKDYGVIGLFIAILLMDSFTQPVSPDVAVFSTVYFTDINIYTIIFIAGLASSIAGVICYIIGQQFGMHFLKKRFHEKSIQKGERIMSKYGPLGVLIGAVTPVPYDLVCYISGIFKVRLPIFIVISVFGRFARFTVIALITFSVF
ncbi:MAG: VTT domain-containing protein [Spirochaetota bacterium]|nr:VTT domain-containing protein [Spirochaetota bacterium]